MKHLRIPAIALALLVSACGGTDAGAEAPMITSFTAEPATVAPGETSTLTWAASGTNLMLTVQAEERRPVTVTGETSYAIRPTVTTRYALTARNSAGTAQKKVVVNVEAVGATDD